MNSLRGSSTHEPLSSGSEPPSPIEEDLAKASAWNEEDTSTLVSTKWKGKGKQRDDDDDDDDDRTVDGDAGGHQAGEYPPMPDEELEQRKIEQNLKRWETLEKQRRKKARDSRTAATDSPSSPSSSSFSVSDVTRRATELWNGRTKPRSDEARPRARTSGHQVLEDVEESEPHPMGETGPPSASSPADTPRTSTADTPRAPPSDNPFENPAYQEPQPDAMMTPAGPGSLPPTPKAVDEKKDNPVRPILQVTHASYIKHPPPKPLDLPAPMSHGERAQQEQVELELEAERKPKKWWTEWLCGLREDGDDQAGRTNPME